MEEIILYTTGCPKCNVLKAKLKQADIQYQEENSIEVMQGLGIMQVPMLGVEGDILDFAQACAWSNSFDTAKGGVVCG